MTYAPLSRFAIGLAALSLLPASCAGGSSGTATGGTSGSSTGSGGSGPGTGGGTSNQTGGVSGTGTGGRGTGGTAAGGAGGIGLTGAGGTRTTGGTSGGAGGASATGGTTGGGGGTGAAPFFTDDFESDTVGQQPAGFDNLINYNYKTANPSSDGSGSALVDGTHAHGGSKAVHVSAQGGSLMVLLERPLPSGIDHLYVRVFLYLANAIGDEPASSNDNHESLIGITADPTSANTQIRFGQIKGAIGTNESVSDNIAPVQADWNMGATISANTWHCVELELDGTASYNSLYAYSDGALVHSITSAADWAHAPGQPATWMSGYFDDIFFGWQSFSSTKNDLWMDDVAMSSTGRIGCD